VGVVNNLKIIFSVVLAISVLFCAKNHQSIFIIARVRGEKPVPVFIWT